MSDALDKVIYGIKRILLNAVEQVTAKGGVNFVGPWTSEETQNAAGETVLNLTYTPAPEASSFPEIVPVATDTLTLDITHRGKILKCTHADGCVVTVPDAVFAANDWVQAYGTLDVVTFVEDGTTTIEPSLASRSVNVRVELLFSAAAVATLNGDIQL